MMFCPQCGQQQISQETRFCSRCGLPLNLIAEVVSNGGTLPALEQLNQKQDGLTRSTGVKFGLAWFLVLTFLMTPVFAILDLEDLTALTAVLGFIGGILMMVFSAIFLPSKPKANFISSQNQIPASNPNFLSGHAGASALPPQQSFPVENYVQPPANSWRGETNDLQPTSVTEGTTKLLRKDE